MTVSLYNSLRQPVLPRPASHLGCYRGRQSSMGSACEAAAPLNPQVRDLEARSPAAVGQS